MVGEDYTRLSGDDVSRPILWVGNGSSAEILDIKDTGKYEGGREIRILIIRPTNAFIMINNIGKEEENKYGGTWLLMKCFKDETTWLNDSPQFRVLGCEVDYWGKPTPWMEKLKETKKALNILKNIDTQKNVAIAKLQYEIKQIASGEIAEQIAEGVGEIMRDYMERLVIGLSKGGRINE